MAAVVGTVTNVSLIEGPHGGLGNVSKYLLLVDTAIYTSSDVLTMTGVTTTIQNSTKKGKTVSLLGAATGDPGQTVAGVAAYARPIFTISGATIQCALGSVSAEANTAAATDVGIVVTVSES